MTRTARLLVLWAGLASLSYWVCSAITWVIVRQYLRTDALPVIVVEPRRGGGA